MNNFLKTIYNIIKEDLKYLRLKNMSPENYPAFLKKEYKRRTGNDLDLNNPQKYTEKMQYAKLNLNTPLKTKLSDKYLVREWVREKIGADYLIPLLGVWDNFSEINFEKLPQRFILKLNSGSGTNIIVKDKNNFNFKKAKLKFDRWLAKNFAFSTDIQLHYKNIESKIIAEEFIEDSNGELNDYRFICFDGKVHFCWVGIEGEDQRYGNIYDLEWNLQPWTFNNLPNIPKKIDQPHNFDEMINIVEILAEGFSHVRVDLYNVDGKIYFGEMTFTSGGGYRLIHPEEYNYIIGDLWEL